MAHEKTSAPNASLSSDMFPNAPYAADAQAAPSVISSRITDIASEDGDTYYPEKPPLSKQSKAQRILGAGSSIKVPRPRSSMSSTVRNGTSSQTTQPGAPPLRGGGGWRIAGGFGGPGGAISNTSRPQSSASRTSKTHVPSLAAHGFFRPMSSQRLQAQRGGRPTTNGQSITSDDGYSEAGSNRYRHSLASNVTSQRGPLIRHDNDVPPRSRGTEFTETEEAGRSLGESERPLRDRSMDPKPYPSVSRGTKQDSNARFPVQKSQGSFRTSYLLPNREHTPSRNISPGQEQLSSTATSPRFTQSKVNDVSAPKPGINYQYFTGNTVFCFRGRLQNARSMPVNVATGLLVVLPSALFFAYSWVLHRK